MSFGYNSAPIDALSPFTFLRAAMPTTLQLGFIDYAIMAIYFAFAVVIAAHAGHYISVPFLILFLMGFAYVGVLSLYQTR